MANADHFNSICFAIGFSPVARHYYLFYSQVSTTVAGMLTAADVEANAFESDTGSLSRDSWARIEDLHKTRKLLAN